VGVKSNTEPKSGNTEKDQPTVFENAFQVFKYLTESGYKVARQTVTNHINDGKLKPRRGGGFSALSVHRYARDFLGKKIDASREMDLPLGETQEPGGYQEARVKADAELKQVQARRNEFLYEREKGRYVRTDTVGRELADRAQALRLHLANWIQEVSGDVAAIFGGDDQRSKELVALVEGDEAKAQELAGWMFSRSSELVAMFRQRLKDALSSYAQGAWFTDEMASAWESYLAGIDDDAEKITLEAIDLVNGDPALVDNLRTRFILSRRDD
jgi:hypothetical protein